MVFIEVGTVLALAFVTYTGTGNLTKPINIKCLDTQLGFNIPTHTFGPWLGAEGSTFNLNSSRGRPESLMASAR